MRASSEAYTGADASVARGFFQGVRSLIDARLDELLPAERDEPESLHAAIRWSVFAGGKRFRPALVLACGEAFGAGQDALLDTACALELIHTYSLIHDDLPAMDDDDLRRGRPTCHVRFGEAVAILAGDVLQTLAFQVISEDEKLSPAVRVRLIAEVARAAGTPRGMVAGQAYDLIAETRESSTEEELERIHRHKTGALIQASARAGAIIAGLSPRGRELQALTDYAAQLGLLFQITDDLLDVTASAEDLGKTPGKDERASKATYPALYGVEAAQARARAAYHEACAALEEIEAPTELLKSIARFILERRA
ncbi:MAG TPA: farnesyl diphosphate synthase [Pyrinomonadaceae bacterium]|nr:farnesyl diphosphate synthase [Pyrinomonadaceae bacterium]